MQLRLIYRSRLHITEWQVIWGHRPNRHVDDWRRCCSRDDQWRERLYHRNVHRRIHVVWLHSPLRALGDILSHQVANRRLGGRCHRSTREDVVGELNIPDGRAKELAKSPKRRTGGQDITIVQIDWVQTRTTSDMWHRTPPEALADGVSKVNLPRHVHPDGPGALRTSSIIDAAPFPQNRSHLVPIGPPASPRVGTTEFSHNEVAKSAGGSDELRSVAGPRLSPTTCWRSTGPSASTVGPTVSGISTLIWSGVGPATTKVPNMARSATSSIAPGLDPGVEKRPLHNRCSRPGRGTTGQSPLYSRK